MPTICWICKKEGATIPDPCCSAPDCEHTGDYAHMKCLSLFRQHEEKEMSGYYE